ncbi:MAG: hypothetical protein RBT62_11180 [Spirochaetia bacterium]|jgi:uncharacterized integral membrane protein|nr:hypothetical protein [Spirochaetia bacterium]
MMPWKLLVFIAVMAMVLVFVGFNLDNRCDLSLVFVTFRSVPVVITLLAAYLLGLLSAFFLALGRRGTSSRRAAQKKPRASTHGANGAIPEHADIESAPPSGASSSGASDSGSKRGKKK